MTSLFFSMLLFTTSFVHATTFTGVDGKKVEVQNPKRVIALNTSTVEVLVALGKADLIVGVDAGSLHPEELIKTKTNLGHPYRPNVEGMISLKPDLVIAPEENLPAVTAEQLRSAKIPVLILENSAQDGVEGLKRRIALLGQVFSAEKEATALITKTEKEMAEVAELVKKNGQTPKIFFLYAHGPGAAFIYGTHTGSHELIKAVGGTNSADFTSGSKPLTAEAMVQASPDVIIMLGRGLKALGGIEGALKLPGVTLTPAGKKKAIIQVDDSIRWIGPRFPQFAKALLSDMEKAK
ncbi:MAG: ABC transporter substrate-binding protein [Bdellovibrio sp.]